MKLGSFLKMFTTMSCPTWALAVVSPQRALRRLTRQCAWHVARSVRYGGARVRFHAHRVAAASRIAFSGPAAPPLASQTRPINSAMTPADIASVKRWLIGAHPFLPQQTAKALRDISANAPVGIVRDEFRDALADINALQAKADEIAAKR